MAVTERSGLTDIGKTRERWNLTHRMQQIAFVPLNQGVLELIADVKMIFDRALAAAGDEDDIGDARGHRFLHEILHDRLVADWLRAESGYPSPQPE